MCVCFFLNDRWLDLTWCGTGGEEEELNKLGDLYSVYPALSGGSRRWEQSVTWITQQTGNYNEPSHTATSRSQQQIITES
jgi:hypothetical protein